MPLELDAEEVVDFALLQVGAGIDARGRRHGLARGHAHVQPNGAAALVGAVEVVDHVKAFGDAGARLALVGRVVDAGHAGEEIVPLAVAQVRQQRQQLVRRHEERLVRIFGPGADDCAGHCIAIGQGSSLTAAGTTSVASSGAAATIHSWHFTLISQVSGCAVLYAGWLLAMRTWPWPHRTLVFAIGWKWARASRCVGRSRRLPWRRRHQRVLT